MPPPPAPTARSSSRSSRTRTSSSRGADAASTGGGEDLIAVGEIVAAHALRGAVRMRAYQPPAPSLAPGVNVVLEQRGRRVPTRVLSAAPHARSQVLLTLEGPTDRNAAEALIGARILVAATSLPPLAENEFYYHEIEGFEVATTDGRALGQVAETFATGANDVWVVKGAGREYLIPAIADVVRTIDRSARRIVIEPMPGLLD